MSPENDPDATIILADKMLLDGVARGASKILIERGSGGTTIRFVVGERTEDYESLPAVTAEALMRRLEVMAGIAFTRKTAGTIVMATGMGASARHRFDLEKQGNVVELRVDSAGAVASKKATRPYPGEAIGVVRAPVHEDADSGWGSVDSEIVVDAKFARGIEGLGTFSHVLVIFWMHESTFDSTRDLVRRPRGREDMPLTGIFSQRAKHRPNPIGVTTAKILRVDASVVRVRGLDAVDGTPVLDLKPYVPMFDRADLAHVPPWMETLMKGYF